AWSPPSMSEDSKPRLDKWLWAARFFKTRGLAKAAVEGGKVHYAGERRKPSKEPRVRDQSRIRQAFDDRTVAKRAIPMTGQSPREAQLLYEETAQSIRLREQAAAARKAAGPGLVISEQRPTKKQRRQIHRFKEQQGD